jgi:hypothetical protein
VKQGTPQNSDQFQVVSEFFTFIKQRSAGNTASHSELVGTAVTNVSATVSNLPSAVSSDSSAAPAVSTQTNSATAASASGTSLFQISPSDTVSNDGEAPTRTLKLAGGKIITFCASQIPDPPAVSYAKSVEDLLLSWDDKSAHWNGTSPLKINDVPIPIIYWPTVYKYWKGTQWQGVKKSWFDWKVSRNSLVLSFLTLFTVRYLFVQCRTPPLTTFGLDSPSRTNPANFSA